MLIGGRPFGPWMLQAIGGPPPPEAFRRRQKRQIEALRQQAEAFRQQAEAFGRNRHRHSAAGTARRTLTPAQRAELQRVRNNLWALGWKLALDGAGKPGPTTAEKEELRRIRSNLRALDALDAADALIGAAAGRYEGVLRGVGAVAAWVAPEVRARAERAAAFAAARCGLKTPEVVFFRAVSEPATRYFGFMRQDVRDAIFVSTATLQHDDQLERTVFHEIRHLAQHPDMDTSVRERDAAEFAEKTLSDWRGQHGC